MPLPMPVNLAADFMKLFDKHHRACLKTWSEPVAEPEGKAEYENAVWWLKNGEQGISSKTMFRYLSAGVSIDVSWESHPLDPDDFRRCSLLLKAVPQFKLRLTRLKAVSEVWANLVDNWDTLEAMLEEQTQARKDNGMYEFMKSLGC